MTADEPRVLFVSHEASRTGAPLSLLQLLHWLRDHTDVSFEVLLLDGGPLVAEFEAVAPTHVIPARSGRVVTGLDRVLADSRLTGLAGLVGGWRWGIRPWRFDVCYLNSVFSAPVLRRLPSASRVVTRVPELEMSFRHWLGEADKAVLFARTDRFIAVSGAVRDNLVANHGVAPDRVTTVHGFVTPPRPPEQHEVDALRAEIDLPDDAVVIGGCGTTDWRKGPDLFVQLARTILQRRPDAVLGFIWLGGDPTGPDFVRAERDLTDAGLGNRVHFLGDRSDPAPFYALVDVFALTSREDPFPRVAIEAAAAGLPIVTFANGGAVELVEQGCGLVVPYLDVEAMADRVIDLIDDPAHRQMLGERGCEVANASFTVEVGAPRMLEVLTRAVGA